MKVNGGTATNTTVKASGTQVVSGGTAVDTTVNAGGSQHVKAGGEAVGTIVNNGGRLYVSDGGKAYDAVLENGAKISALAGGVAGATVKNGGTLVILAGGTAAKTTVQEGGILTVSQNATLNDVTLAALEGGTASLKFIAGVIANTVTIGKGWNVTNSGTLNGVTLAKGGSLKISAGQFNNLNVLAGADAGSIYADVNGAKLAGSANLKYSVQISDVEFLAGAAVKNNGGDALTVSNANAEAEGFELDAVKRNDPILRLTKNDGTLFLNGNTVTMTNAVLDFGTAGMVYAGKELGGISGEQEIDCNLRFNQVNAEGCQIFGGGKVSGSCQATITGTTSTLTLQSESSASRLYAGYDVMESADTNLTIKGDSKLSIDGGTYGYARGGVVKSDGTGGAMTVEGDASTSMGGESSVFSLAGDYQVGANAQFTRKGDVRVSVGGQAKIEGDLVGAGLSFGGTYALEGNSTLTISGGTIEGDIYGGIAVGNTGNAIKDSAKCNITGQTEVKIDCSTNTITLGKENEITSIFVGSFGKGEVSSLGTLRVTGKEANLTLKGVVELIGDSSAATNKKSYVDSSRLLFDGFTGELGVHHIAAFETVEIRAGSDVELNNLVTNKLADVSKWVFKAKDGQSTLSLGGDGWELGDDGFFNGDRLELTFDEALAEPWTLMTDTNGKGLFNDLGEGNTVKFKILTAGEEDPAFTTAEWDRSKSAFVSGDFSLGVEDGNKLVLSKLASA